MSKQTQITQFITDNSGSTYRTADMCEQIGCSLPTLLKFIKANPDMFEKTGHGIYTLNANTKTMTVSETTQVHTQEVSTTETDIMDNVVAAPIYQPSTPRPTFDW